MCQLPNPVLIPLSDHLLCVIVGGTIWMWAMWLLLIMPAETAASYRADEVECTTWLLVTLSDIAIDWVSQSYFAICETDCHVTC